MKPTFFFVLFFLTISYLFSQECDKCPFPRVAIYDCDVQVQIPGETNSSGTWYNLFMPSVVANEYLIKNGFTSECISKIDQTIIELSDIQGGILKLGSESANRAPAGAIYSSDYLIRSVVSEINGNYSLNLILETSVSREIVKSIEISFTNDLESAQSAGQQAAMNMIPLYDIIKQFEVRKRNTDSKVAIRLYWKKGSPDEIIITPSKNIVKPGETIKVKIKMPDCDGVPLANRKISFKDISLIANDYSFPILLEGTRGGIITPDEVTTDDAGEATVEFKAEEGTETACIKANYPHLAPSGKTALFEGSAFVQIQPPPPEAWLLTAEFEEFYSEQTDTTKSFSYGSMLDVIVEEVLIKREIKGKVMAIVQNQAEDLKNDFIIDAGAGDPPFMMVSGTGQIDHYTKHWHTIGETLVDAEIRIDHASGNARPGASFRIVYNGEEKSMQATMGIKAVGSYHIRKYRNEGGEFQWSDSYYDINDYSINAGDGCSMNDEQKVCILIKEGQGFSGVISIYEKTKYSLHKGYVKIDLIPYTEKSLSQQVAGKR